MTADLQTPRCIAPAAEFFGPHLTVIATTRSFVGARSKEWAMLADELVRLMGAPLGTPVLFGDQVHGATVLPATEALSDGEPCGAARVTGACDAFRLDVPNCIAVARTADCVPVVIGDPVTGAAAVCHAGWRGTLDGIVPSAIASIVESGVPAARLRVWVGPHISGERYEVSPELIETFVARHGDLGRFHEGRLLDLGALNALQATASGVPAEQVADSGWCTLSSPALFPSYRRDGECRGQIFTAVWRRS